MGGMPQNQWGYPPQQVPPTSGAFHTNGGAQFQPQQFPQYGRGGAPPTPPNHSAAMFASMPGNPHQAQVHSPMQQQPQPNVFEFMLNPAINTGPWSFQEGDPAKFYKVFGKNDKDKDGFVKKSEAIDILKKSTLEEENYEHVWNMVDIDRDGFLDFLEFAAFMLITVGVTKRDKELPKELPDNLKQLKPQFFLPQTSGPPTYHSEQQTMPDPARRASFSSETRSERTAPNQSSSSKDRISDAFGEVSQEMQQELGTVPATTGSVDVADDRNRRDSGRLADKAETSSKDKANAGLSTVGSSSLDSTLDYMHNTLASENQRYRRTEEYTATARKDLHILETEKKGIEQRIERVRQSIRREQQEYDQIVAKISETREAIKKLREQADSWDQSSKQVSATVNYERGRLQELITELSRLQNGRNVTEKDVSAKVEETVNKEHQAAEINEAASQLEAVEQQHNAEAELLEKEIEALTKAIEMSKNDKQLATEKLELWRERASAADNKLNESRKKVSQAKQRSVQARKRHEQALEEKQNLISTVKENGVGAASSEGEVAEDEEFEDQAFAASYSAMKEEKTEDIGFGDDDFFDGEEDAFAGLSSEPLQSSNQAKPVHHDSGFEDAENFSDEFNNAGESANKVQSMSTGGSGSNHEPARTTQDEEDSFSFDNAAESGTNNGPSKGNRAASGGFSDDFEAEFDNNDFDESQNASAAKQTNDENFGETFEADFDDDQVFGANKETPATKQANDEDFGEAFEANFDDDDHAFGPNEETATQQAKNDDFEDAFEPEFDDDNTFGSTNDASKGKDKSNTDDFADEFEADFDQEADFGSANVASASNAKSTAPAESGGFEEDFEPDFGDADDFGGTTSTTGGGPAPTQNEDDFDDTEFDPFH